MTLNFPTPTRTMTAEEFDAYAELPENRDKILEFIAGEVHEVPSNPWSSKIAGIIQGELYIFLKGKNLGHLTGEAGGYRVSDDRYAPDVAFISKEKRIAPRGYNPDAPDLAVEVDFPSDVESQRRLRLKVSHYMAAGTVAWLVFPERRIVEVHVPGQTVKILTEAGTLDGGTVLPGFTLPVKDIFPPIPEE
jgi:Uma2 family endonuclease